MQFWSDWAKFHERPTSSNIGIDKIQEWMDLFVGSPFWLDWVYIYPEDLSIYLDVNEKLTPKTLSHLWGPKSKIQNPKIK